ncbi:MAG: hypothetical protein V1934_08300 [Methanobacteriota archaeon]
MEQPTLLVDELVLVYPPFNGLSDGEEVSGWLVQVEIDNAPVADVTYTATSDPTKVNSDGDLLDDNMEKQSGTDPRYGDTDNDGLMDGDELEDGIGGGWMLPGDSDGDGTANGPTDWDSDGYGHVSGNEDGSTGTSGDDDEDDCEVWFDVWQNDGDGDGIPYPYEIQNGLSPIHNDAHIDTDGDGIQNWYEYKYGLNIFDPSDADYDYDGDGLLSKWEYLIGWKNPRDSSNVYKIKLSVSIGWEATIAEINQIKDGFKGASLYLMTCTDGYAYISDVTIYNNMQNWNNVNIRVGDQDADETSDTYWPHVKNLNGYWNGINWGFPDGEVSLPRTYNGYSFDSCYMIPTIVHELGHYVF